VVVALRVPESTRSDESCCDSIKDYRRTDSEIRSAYCHRVPSGCGARRGIHRGYDRSGRSGIEVDKRCNEPLRDPEGKFLNWIAEGKIF
jgi:hypothetical protein